MRNKVLSVIIPSYNEGATICRILEKISEVKLPENTGMELIVVDDGSADRTQEAVGDFAREHPQLPVRYVRHDKNQGKGMAIRTGIGYLTGDYVIIQDADLEYDPQDYCVLLPHLLSGEHQVVYGSRFLNKSNTHSYQSFYWGGRLVSFVTNLLYGQHLTDEPTCYKMFATSLLKSIELRCTGFEFCPEVTAKVSRLGHKIKEIPIDYYPRSIEEGKKIKWTDGLEAIKTLIKYRFKK